jgi:hypothetical protein
MAADGGVSELGALLAANGLGAFAQVFASEQVTLDTVGDLNENDLKEMAIPIGPRKNRCRCSLKRS